jgi:hypothetical protein
VTATPITTAAHPMGTGTSKPRVGLAAIALALAACGSAGGTSAFSWLHPHAPPSSWQVVRVPSRATLAFPPGWQRQHGDPGTATAAVLGPAGRFLGYLNLTPRQGDETLSDWASFRIEHNAEEGDRAVTRLAAATGLHFLTGHGSCVKDSYTTSINARYVEIACLVAGARTASVIVGAAPPDRWRAISPAIQRSISGVRT